MPSFFSKKTNYEKLTSFFKDEDIDLSQEEIKRVEKKKPDVLYKIGSIYLKRKQYSKALEWFQKAARKEHGESLNEIGWMYRNGFGVSKDYEEALEYYHRAEQVGNTMAQTNIGYMYCNGFGVYKSYKFAMFWYQRAAANGNTHAQNNIGFMYEHGLGLTQDFTAAMNWYLKAAMNGDMAAQSNVGRFYQNGLGVTKNINQAIEWFMKADSNGDGSAAYNLGWIYEFENEVRDKQKAINWYRISANRGHKDGKSRLNIVLDTDFSIKVEPKGNDKLEYRWEIEEMTPENNLAEEKEIKPMDMRSTFHIQQKQLEEETKLITAEKPLQINMQKEVTALEQKLAQLMTATTSASVIDDAQNDLYYDDSSDEENHKK